ncbi:MAG TPA: MerR family transcriptional regulator [Candidatus Hydrogenedens sp.]|nr:MerR family transcriptional regulator [Candidatus Hydrogenedens sp.]
MIMFNKTDKVYTIKEVSELTGVPIYKIRQWEKQIKKLKPKRHPKTNWRFYTDEDIKTLREVNYLLRHKKMRLQGIDNELTKIERLGDTTLDRIAIQNLLRQIRLELNQIRILAKSLIEE